MLVLLLSCENVVENNNVASVNSDNLLKGLIDVNSDLVNIEINKLTIDLVPSKANNDRFGHKENINLLIERLNLNCDNIEAEFLCYACIKTYPLQSEIQMTIDSSGTPITRIIDISTPDDAILQCIRVH
jgi:hypothetical protein